MIIGEKISLRTVRIVDIPLLFEWENNPANWEVSETQRQFTFHEINLLLESAEDIFETGQLRFVIVDNVSKEIIGTIDLFQADFEMKSVHLGILISNERNRRKGFAEEAIKLISQYCEKTLILNQLHCTVQSFNGPSLALFKKCGFEKMEEGKENPIFDSNSDNVVKMKLWLKK